MFSKGDKCEAIAVTLPDEALCLGLDEQGEETGHVLEILRDNVVEHRRGQGDVSTGRARRERRGSVPRGCSWRKHQGVRSLGELLVLRFL